MWPYDSGEVCVQHYNSVLTLSHVTKVSDAVLIMENEVATQACRKMLHLSSPSYKDLNSVIVQHLCMVLLPVSSVQSTRSIDGSMCEDDAHPHSDATVSALSALCNHPVSTLCARCERCCVRNLARVVSS